MSVECWSNKDFIANDFTFGGGVLTASGTPIANTYVGIAYKETVTNPKSDGYYDVLETSYPYVWGPYDSSK